ARHTLAPCSFPTRRSSDLRHRHAGLGQRLRRALGRTLFERDRDRDLDVLEGVVETRIRLPWPVGGLEVVAQAERLVVGPLAQVGDRLVADHVVGVAAEPDRGAVDDALGIEVAALAAQDRPVVEAGRVGLDVPLADHAGVVTGLAQQHRPGDLVVAQAALAVEAGLLAVAGDGVGVRVQAGEARGPAGPAGRG